MHNILLSDGSLHTIFNDIDLINLAEEKLGSEYAKCINDFLPDYDYIEQLENNTDKREKDFEDKKDTILNSVTLLREKFNENISVLSVEDAKETIDGVYHLCINVLSEGKYDNHEIQSIKDELKRTNDRLDQKQKAVNRIINELESGKLNKKKLISDLRFL